MKENVIVDKTYSLALKVVKFCFEMQNQRHEYVISRHLLKSGTSVGANIEEAQGVISKAEFISKVQISYKEAKETKFWLRLILDSHILESITSSEVKGKPVELLTDCDEIIINLTSILKSSKANNG